MLESSDGTVLEETDNKDLIWDFEKFSQRNIARDFIMRFENNLCVYSGTVGQLYSNYSIFFPKEERGRLVILPNPYSHHDTFQGIPDSAVKATGLHIVPDMKSDKHQMMLRIPLKTKHEPFRDVPLQVGLQLINKRRPPSLPLLPVVIKGDLREFDQSMPMLHLHCISLQSLTSLSNMESNNIRDVIINRLKNI